MGLTKGEPRRTGDLRALLRAILTFVGPRLLPTLAIVALGAALEGFGIVMLLPMAEVIFAQQNGGAVAGVTATVLHWLGAAGLDTEIAQLSAMGAAFVILVGLRALVMLRRDVVLAELSFGFVDSERRRFFALLAQADWPVIKRFRKAHLLNTMTTNISRLSQLMTIFTRAIVTLALGMAVLAAAFVVSWTLGLLLLAISGLALVFALLWSGRSHRSGALLNKAHHGVMEQTTRFLDGLKSAKATRAEEALARGYSAAIDDARGIQVAFIIQQGKLRNAIQVSAALFALLVLLAGIGLLEISGGELLVMVAIIIRLAPSLVQVFGSIQSLAHALPAFSAIRSLESKLMADQARLRQEATDETAFEPGPDPAAPLEMLACAVQAFDDSGQPASLVETGDIIVPPGALVHIGGGSGAGKSSLVELAAGLHLPALGVVRRGDMSLDARSCRAWQGRVSYAPQEPFLFDDTVRANLCWPNLSPDDAAIWEVLETVEAADLVRKLPRGLEEPLLDSGARLSGGERQRLCLARALLRDADLLILDEATSAMDPALERAIVARLHPAGSHKIVLMVSHSRNALDLADMRIDVTQGRAEMRA